MRPWHIRTQAEILERIEEALARGDQGDEVHEYMRCAKFIPLSLRSVYQDTTVGDWIDEANPGEVVCDDVRAIDEVARKYIHIFERAARRYHPYTGPRAATIINQYRAWKWLLGHYDVDYFDVHETGPLTVYRSLMIQMNTGQWDKMTRQASRERNMKNETNESSSGIASASKVSAAPTTQQALA